MLNRPILDGAKITWGSPMLITVGWWVAVSIRILRGSMPTLHVGTDLALPTFSIFAVAVGTALAQHVFFRVRHSRKKE